MCPEKEAWKYGARNLVHGALANGAVACPHGCIPRGWDSEQGLLEATFGNLGELSSLKNKFTLFWWNILESTREVHSPSVCGDLNIQKPKLSREVCKLLCKEGINLIIVVLCWNSLCGLISEHTGGIFSAWHQSLDGRELWSRVKGNHTFFFSLFIVKCFNCIFSL